MENRGKGFQPWLHKVKWSTASEMPKEDMAEGGTEVGEGYTGREEMPALTCELRLPAMWLVDCVDVQK